MKKIIISAFALLSVISVSAEAKFKVEDIQNTVYNQFINEVVTSGTNQVFIDLYNSKVADYTKIKKNLDLTKKEVKKEVSEYAFKEILADLGYDVVLKFKDSDPKNIELAINVDKSLTELESKYFLNLVDVVFSNIYGKGVQGQLKVYSDKELTKLIK